MAEPFWMDGSGLYTDTELRRFNAGLYTSSSPGGVIGSGLVVTAGAGMSVNVSAGFAFVYTDSNLGAYIASTASTTNVSIPTTTGQTHTIYAQVQENSTGLVVDKATNTSVIPALAIKLATVTVTSVSTFTISSAVRVNAEDPTVAGRFATTASFTALGNRVTTLEDTLTSTPTQGAGQFISVLHGGVTAPVNNGQYTWSEANGIRHFEMTAIFSAYSAGGSVKFAFSSGTLPVPKTGPMGQLFGNIPACAAVTLATGAIQNVGLQVDYGDSFRLIDAGGAGVVSLGSLFRFYAAFSYTTYRG